MRGTLAALPARCRGLERTIEWPGTNTLKFSAPRRLNEPGPSGDQDTGWIIRARLLMSAPAVAPSTPQRFSTETFAPGERVAAWREV